MRSSDKARFIIYQLWYPFVIMQVFLFCFADRRNVLLTDLNKKLNRSPELESSFLNRLTLWWFTPIPLLGSRKTLVISDLYQLNEGNAAAYLSSKWNNLWKSVEEDYHKRRRNYENAQRNVSQSKSKKKNGPKPPSIVWRLFLMFRFEVISAASVKILADVLQFASPFFLK
ncbi:unnamed protein product [Gongylonema pulchrum]|uniref:ABC transmembrane type-1 domain-containing protein n=1 Tax=Gongylonema pulchrum TaxID=637853 RepID=A0A183ERQ4_9BILA|nr:unnamed protein product [Gongylonema pulchrum]